jgi:hypothetical protein
VALKISSRLSPSTVTVVTTAETVVATMPAIVYDLPAASSSGAGAGQGVTITASVNATNSAATTTATLRVRQGTLTGPIVGVGLVQPATPSVAQEFFIEEFDNSRVPAQSGGVVYVVTIQYAGATGNSTVNECVVDVAGS